MGTAQSPIAVRFETWNEHQLLGDEAAAILEHDILVDTPRSSDDAAKMLTVLLAELAGERCDGADLAALASIRNFLVGAPNDPRVISTQATLRASGTLPSCPRKVR